MIILVLPSKHSFGYLHVKLAFVTPMLYLIRPKALILSTHKRGQARRTSNENPQDALSSSSVCLQYDINIMYLVLRSIE